MKITNAEVRSKNAEIRNRTAGDLLPSAFCLRTSQRGVALVLTLILLSVTLVMALAFLAISGHERGSVTTQTDTATTRLAAEAGLAAAEAQITANILSSTNPYSFGLLVSTNYVVPPLIPANPLGDLANLQFSPRAPVWLSNTVTHAMENRFYLDLNRNGVDDPNGWVPETNSAGLPTGNYVFEVGDPEWIGVLARPDLPYSSTNKFIARYAFIAVPVGNTLDLNAIHNQARILPKNYSVNPMNPLDDGYFRNQGVGSWELNLAAFLADLNTNQWGQIIGNSANGNTTYYYYQYPPDYINAGVAFNDAFSLLTNRYAGNYSSLIPVGGNAPNGLFTTANVFPPFQNNIDFYSDGPLQTTPAGINVSGQNVTWPWAGADNTNHFFTPDDLFNTNETAGFGVHLLAAGANTVVGNAIPTYDRYTFYRMLSQLGTDTAPESGKMDLNYDNLDVYVTNGVVYPPSAANFMAWQPLPFFMNAADRLLKAYTAQWANIYLPNQAGVLTNGLNPNFVATFNVTNAFGVTGIPVLVSNQFVYTPAVNRLLQLAANIYDATTANLGVNGNTYDYPSVFRPLFTVVQENGNGYRDVYITGYTNVTLAPSEDISSDPQFTPPVDASDLAMTNLPPNQPVNVYGVPWIVGAKKGFPNFNELAMDSAFQLTRKVEVTRPSPGTSYLNYSYYQMFILNLTNQVGVECWNSYTNAYTNSVMIYVNDNLKNVVLTNDEGFSINLNIPLSSALPVTAWSGFTPTSQNGPSFQIPLNYAVMAISNSIYRFNQGGVAPYLTPDLGEIYETNVTGYPQPHWGLTMTNDLRVLMVDTTVVPNRVIDYVELSGPNSSLDLTSEILSQYDTDTTGNDLWATNWSNSLEIPQGLANQVQVSMGLSGYNPDPTSGAWGQTDPTLQQNEIDGFRAYYGLPLLHPNNPGESDTVAEARMTNAMQVPYTPTAAVVQHVSWQANDPLVHYLANDLNWVNAVRNDRKVTSLTDTSDGDNLGMVNRRYAPWGLTMPPGTDQVDQNPYNLAYKDPLMFSSDNWDFPRYKLPTAGWLGRVHRGTPWQTVYLKSTNMLAWVQSQPTPANGATTWRDWTGNYNPFDAANAGPVQDWLLFDLFTTAFNDNATRGTLSVNQSADEYDPVANPTAGLAAWSALFSGVVVPPTSPTNSYTFINPAGQSGVNSALGELVTNINYTRNNFKNADGLAGVFEHEGDILATPLLTDHSPFLDPAQAGYNNDEMYEWLPQQVMSLVRVGTPRYVIYSYGQALKPAPNGIYLGTTPAGTFGMVTNYQVVSEITTRTVLRIETVRTNANGAITVTPPRAVIESFNILPPD